MRLKVVVTRKYFKFYFINMYVNVIIIEGAIQITLPKTTEREIAEGIMAWLKQAPGRIKHLK